MTERTARRRKTRRFEVEEEEPQTAPWTDEDGEDDDEDEAPRARRRRKAEADDEEDAPPVKRRAKKAPRDEEDEYDEETGDEEADGEDTVDVPIARGDDAIKQKRGSTDNAYFRYPQEEGEEQVVKFLEDEPWSYEQHWVPRKGKQSFPCIGKECPLCEIGNKTTTKMVYTIVNLTMEESPVQTLEVTATNYDTLRAFNKDKKTGPLTRLYWALSRTKKTKSSGYGNYNYSFLPVKERDLDEDYGIDPDIADEAIKEGAKKIPSPQKVLGKVTRRALEDIADEAME